LRSPKCLLVAILDGRTLVGILFLDGL
jgi:hypothetical protein